MRPGGININFYITWHTCSLLLFQNDTAENEKENQKNKKKSFSRGVLKKYCICEYIIIEFYLVFCCYILLIYNAIRFIQYLFYSILHFPSCFKLDFYTKLYYFEHSGR